LPESGSPAARRRALGVALRALRVDRGWTVDQLADRLLCSPSKVSRMETGQRGVSSRDIRDLARIYELDDARREQLTELAAEGKQPAWYQRQALRGSRYVGLEAAAATISDFALGLIPGLLQTSDYATAIMQATLPVVPADVMEQRVEARLARQTALIADNHRQFEALLDESVLYREVGGPDVMTAQLERLTELSGRPNVTIRALPFSGSTLPSNNNKFIILTFAEPALPSIVFVETLTDDLYFDRAEDVAEYQDAFRIMRDRAASAERTRAMIEAAISRFRT
jgi:transcriptional regulator with XRE-family HTH domain